LGRLTDVDRRRWLRANSSGALAGVQRDPLPPSGDGGDRFLTGAALIAIGPV